MNDKETGSFYTPQSLVEYMVKYIEKRCSPANILEPSAGDGRFVKPLLSFGALISLIENDSDKAKQLESSYSDSCKSHCCDFISFAMQTDEKYDLIIGNPPYIAKKNISEDQRNLVKQLLEYYSFLDKSVFQNMWVAFVLGSIRVLSEAGSIFFVLPFEFLQVQYAEKLRNYLEDKFNIIEIITFEQQVFKEIEQDICLVFLTNECEGKPYIQYTTLTSIETLELKNQSKIMRNKPLQKWSNSILNDEETEFLKKIANQYPRISSFGECAPGIVTGANSYFILSKKDFCNLNIPEEYQLPIVSKSSMLPSLLKLTQQDYSRIENNTKKRTQLLNLSKLSVDCFTPALTEYIKKGEADGINNRYKCKKRKRWYDVPIVQNGTVWFFKRYHVLPRMIENMNGIYTTDIAYNVRLHDTFDASSLCFSFYNSLTLALCEYSGRFYGGGVCELVPSEFKNLHVPYKRVSPEKIMKLDNMFRKGTDIKGIIDFVDEEVLGGLAPKELALLKSIRNRYLFRRIKQLEGDAKNEH